MQKAEFEERIEGRVSDEDYKLIEFVYQWHPVIRNVSGKDEVAELYKSFGMALFRDMEPRAKKAKEVEEQMTSCSSSGYVNGHYGAVYALRCAPVCVFC